MRTLAGGLGGLLVGGLLSLLLFHLKVAHSFDPSSTVPKHKAGKR